MGWGWAHTDLGGLSLLEPMISSMTAHSGGFLRECRDPPLEQNTKKWSLQEALGSCVLLESALTEIRNQRAPKNSRPSIQTQEEGSDPGHSLQA